MVRVVCVHHFTSQDVFPLPGEGVPGRGCAAGPGDWLLVAGEHCISIRDLKKKGQVLASFPTVDMVQQLLYCIYGESSKYRRV